MVHLGGNGCIRWASWERGLTAVSVEDSESVGEEALVG